ncbi:MAG: AMP-binding protein [Dehalococcoidia bacterium]|nr:AMP-binding protein [Dehalococcoidia bacterium]
MENVDTLPKLIKSNHEKWGDGVAMSMKNFGIWQRYTWQDYYERVKYFSLGLISLGLEPGDRVCIIGDNEPEWFWGEFATQAAGGVATGIFVDSIPSEVKYIAAHSDAKFAIVNDQEQTDKFLEIKDELPSLKKVIYWDPKGLRNYDDPIIISFTEVMKLGREYEKSHPGLFEQNVEKGKGEDIAFIYYTSGTTGLPKGAALSHKALIKTAQGFVSRYPLSHKDDLISNFPAAWVGDSFFATVPHLLTRARMNFAEEPETIAEDTREVGPHFTIYGPRQWESIVSDIQVKMIDANPLKRFCYDLFLPVGYKIADFGFEDKTPNLFWWALYWIAHGLLFRPLKDKLGLSNVRFGVTGSSVLSLDTFRLIHAVGIELRQNYAGTEAGFISSHGKGEIKFESVGRPATGTEVRETDDGELLIRSECMFNEYYKDPEKTKEALIGGWFHSGDAVHISDEGHLIFLDRVKDMGELATGAKYAPQYIEGRLRFSPYIKDAMVIGGKDKDFVSAIVNIDFAMVGKWAEKNRVPYTTFVDLSQKKEVAGLVQKDLVRVNGYLPEGSRVKRFVLLHKEFDPDEAELTRTRKLRRGFMEERYRALIDAMYSEKEEIKVEAPVTYRDGRKGVVTTAIKVRTI